MAEKKKRHFNRRAYLEDFHRSVSGEYVYDGATYSFSSANGMTRRQAIGVLWLFGGVLLAASVAQGCLPAESMLGCAYVLLPYGGMLVSAASAIWALARLSANRDPLREYIYKATVEALPGRSLFAFIFSVAALVGEGIFLFTHGFRDGGYSAILLVLMLFSLASAFLLLRAARLLRWTKDGERP